jgi:hypothetical protein
VGRVRQEAPLWSWKTLPAVPPRVPHKALLTYLLHMLLTGGFQGSLLTTLTRHRRKVALEQVSYMNEVKIGEETQSLCRAN